MKRIEVTYLDNAEPVQYMLAEVPHVGESFTVAGMSFPVTGVAHTADPIYSEPVARLTVGEPA